MLPPRGGPHEDSSRRCERCSGTAPACLFRQTGLSAIVRDVLIDRPVCTKGDMTAITSHFPADRTLSPRVAFGLLTSMLLMLLASSSAPTPLYATYQAEWGFSAITVTVIFGVYAIAVLLALLVFGSLSDHIGRRPVLVGSLGMQAAVMALFAFAGDV